MTIQHKMPEWGKLIREAGVTPLYEAEDSTRHSQKTVRLWVLLSCCQREEVMTLDRILRRAREHTTCCRSCNLNQHRQHGFRKRVTEASRGDPPPVTPPTWPVPPSVLLLPRLYYR